MQPPPTSFSSNTWLSDGCALLDIGLGEGLLDDWHEQVGPYRLVEKLGEGGLGVVWRAEQTEPIRRSVAVKLIKSGLHRSAEVITRFELERQALARMNHPNIAAILDAGTLPDDRPWFVMELVPGLPLTAFCKSSQLSRAERLHLMIAICQAVHHAHQKGILHRDLKPSNILVHEQDGRPVPKIIDFGIAKALDAADGELSDPFFQTRVGDAPSATYPYMSPEQAVHGVQELDTRSDIYTLGVILYEVLTGTLPMPDAIVRSGSYEKIADHVRLVEAVAPSSHDASLKGDLDWICLRALEKDPERRYESASALADDLRRYLSDEPVTAGPPSTAYRLRKWARRNRAAFITGILVVSSITAGLVATSLALVRERQALQRESTARQQADASLTLALQREREALVAREAESKARVAAEVARKDAEKARNAAVESRRTSDVARATAESLMNDIIFDLRDQLEPIGRLSLLEPVSKSAENYFNLVPAAADNDDQQRNRAVVLQSRGALLLAKGDLSEARTKLDESLKLFRQRAAEKPSDLRRQHDLALALERLGNVAELQGKTDEALTLYEEMRQCMAGLTGGLESADVSLPDERLGDLALSGGQVEEAMRHFENGIRLLDESHATDGKAKIRRAVLLEKMGAVNAAQGKSAEADDLYRAALKLVEAQLASTPDDTALLAASGVLHGKCAAVAKLSADALEHAKQQTAVFEQLVKRDPLRVVWQRQMATAWQQLGTAYEEEGDLAEAITSLRHAVETLSALRLAHPDLPGLERELAAYHLRLAAVLLKSNLGAEAKNEAQMTLDLLKKLPATSELQQWQRTAEAIIRE